MKRMRSSARTCYASMQPKAQLLRLLQAKEKETTRTPFPQGAAATTKTTATTRSYNYKDIYSDIAMVILILIPILLIIITTTIITSITRTTTVSCIISLLVRATSCRWKWTESRWMGGLAEGGMDEMKD